MDRFVAVLQLFQFSDPDCFLRELWAANVSAEDHSDLWMWSHRISTAGNTTIYQILRFALAGNVNLFSTISKFAVNTRGSDVLFLCLTYTDWHQRVSSHHMSSLWLWEGTQVRMQTWCKSCTDKTASTLQHLLTADLCFKEKPSGCSTIVQSVIDQHTKISAQMQFFLKPG